MSLTRSFDFHPHSPSVSFSPCSLRLFLLFPSPYTPPHPPPSLRAARGRAPKPARQYHGPAAGLGLGVARPGSGRLGLRASRPAPAGRVTRTVNAPAPGPAPKAGPPPPPPSSLPSLLSVPSHPSLPFPPFHPFPPFPPFHPVPPFPPLSVIPPFRPFPPFAPFPPVPPFPPFPPFPSFLSFPSLPPCPRGTASSRVEGEKRCWGDAERRPPPEISRKFSIVPRVRIFSWSGGPGERARRGAGTERRGTEREGG